MLDMQSRLLAMAMCLQQVDGKSLTWVVTSTSQLHHEWRWLERQLQVRQDGKARASSLAFSAGKTRQLQPQQLYGQGWQPTAATA